ncbi:sensor domain-containing protein [Vibrio parahaemolyticus]|uniref:sensor domain-containing protein n=1 Tax=Vibrio parahaemolyticus TaxID=670 RepID=UPI0011215901|nr:EAL domain-containing protein [Vibrio parahaemolyticus]TON70167.1 GGDEF domain-containing protein [Vibrio parahaemolyticus]
MFRFAIPSPLMTDWQHALQQCCDVTQAQGQLYTLSYTKQWLSSEVSTSPQNHRAIVAMIEQNCAQLSAPHFDVVCSQFDDENLSLCPVWLPNEELFAVVTLTHSTQQKQTVSAWLSALAGRISFDVSQHYHQELKRHHSHANKPLPTLQEFIDCLDDHIWIKTTDGLYAMTNRSVEQAWKKSNDDIVGKNDFDLFSAERAEKFIDADRLVVATGTQNIVEECRQIDENNNPTWLETIKSPVRNQAGDLIGILGMTRNITRRKMVETQLSLASKIFNNSQEGMVITDSNANIIDVNNAFSQITGFSAEEVIGKNPNILRSGHHDDAFYQQLWQQLETKGQWKGEFINRKRDGSIYPQLATISAVMDDKNHLINYICVFEDISVRKAHEEKLQRMAFYDPLTNLPNRTHLISLLEQHIEMEQPFATLFLDIDHFKHINDSMGHFCGDQLLSKLAVRLQDILHLNAHVARIGGDEFVIVLPDIDGDSPLLETLSSILGVFRRPFDLANHDSLRISTSIGIALYPNDGQDSETLLKNADTAMYLAKKNGRNGYAFYSPDLTDKSVSHVRIQSALHEAIEKEQLHLVYQPQYNLAQNAIIGVEALVRWEHPEFGLVPPADFIPIAEKTGLIQSIGEWVLKDACLQGTDWLARGVQFGKIAVNVSALQLQQSRFINKLKTILRETGFPAHRLELEITESFLLIDPKLAIASLNQLCELGIEISLDDFGTGYSSLSYLKGLPINKLKIDRSFVSDVPNDNDSNAIVNAIIAMGTTLSLKVVAEGIETPEQVAYLVDKGCIYGQGYLFSPPVAAEKLFN